MIDLGRGAATAFTLPSTYHYKITFCKLFTAALFSIGLWNHPGGAQTCLYPSKICSGLAERKALKVALLLLLLLKETWQPATVVNERVCPKDSHRTTLCPGYFVNREKDLSSSPVFLLEHAEHPSPWSETWACRCLSEWKKWLILFLLTVPKSQYTALTSHFPSLVFSDRHLIQSGRSGTWSAACTENWGFDRQFFLGNFLCNGCMEQHSATKLFDISTQSEAIWKNYDDQ